MVEMTQELIQTPVMLQCSSISAVFPQYFGPNFRDFSGFQRTGRRQSRELTGRIPMSFHRISGTLERLERFRPQGVPILGTTEILLQ